MPTLLRLTLPLFAWLCCGLLYAAEPRLDPDPAQEARTVTILQQPVVMLQAKFGLDTPEERVKQTAQHLRAITPADLRHPIQITAATRYGQPVRLFSIQGKPLLLLAQQDLDIGDDLTLDQAAERVQRRLEQLRSALIEQRSPHALMIAGAKLAGGTALLVGLLWLSRRLQKRLRSHFAIQIIQHRGWIPYKLRTYLGHIERRISTMLLIVVCSIASYIWLIWALKLFPMTRYWSYTLNHSSLAEASLLLQALWDVMPNLLVLLAIFILTLLIQRMLRLLFLRVETGRLKLPGLYPDTVGATRRLLSVIIWLFALSLAYPFFPGADTLAFKGVSVFFGLMITLGSAGLVSHVMSGLVLIYSRALHQGDYVRIGEYDGFVSDIGILATKLKTREGYDVTIPNAVVASGKIINLSTHARQGGIIITTSVTIGYDVPWRQVQAMLTLAVQRTEGILHEEALRIRQTELQDWYVSYELQTEIAAGEAPAQVKSTLHGHILDVFNQFGVQIMSPHFVMQPKEAVWVKPEAWFSAPAQPPNAARADEVESAEKSSATNRP
ncbi:mechanosensitive ion channel family protein [Edwardsiella tarda]